MASWCLYRLPLIVLIALSPSMLANASAQIVDCRGTQPPPFLYKGVEPGPSRENPTIIEFAFEPEVPEFIRQGFLLAVDEWNLWNRFTRHNVRIAPSDGVGSPQLNIGAKYSPNPSQPTTAAQFIGQTNNPTNPSDRYSYFLNGRIDFTTNTSILDNSTGAFQFAMHEIGHLLGLGDTNRQDGKSVMNRYLGKNDSQNGQAKRVSLCDATAVASAQHLAPGPWVGSGGCPGGGCFGYQPFPPPCTSFSTLNAWCYGNNPSPTIPETFLPPGGYILSPAHGSVINGWVTFTLATGDPDGRAMQVEWFVNGYSMWKTLVHPFSWTVNVSGATPGAYIVQARVTDNHGLTAPTQQITVTKPTGGGGGGGTGALYAGSRLYGGQIIWSPNGAYYLGYQPDGNLVVSTSSGSPIWASMSFGAPGYTEMQSDGNVVSYNASGVPYWATMTFGSSYYLRLNNDGSLGVYSSGGLLACMVSNLSPGQQCP